MNHCPTRVILLLLCVAVFSSACASTSAISPQDKKKADAARDLGEAYFREKQYTAALGELLKAEKLNPNDPALHNDLGLVYMAKEKYDLAATHFQKAVELNPEYTLAKNNLGSVYLARKEWDKAIAVLEPVTKDMLYATPHYPLSNLGWAYYNKGDYDKARQYLEEALALKPDFAIARLNLARTFMATGRLLQARTLLEKIASESPKNPVVLLELGKTYRLLGDYNNARLALRGAIEFTEDSNLALEASEELRKLY
ncbi:tetratricopeptide repeat protein [uncultured Desulfosarcina sp.]|uniref:tetratricopeptide repeat protein n=1 Tax=uncultured Desulfosarcina sp. TaxID=218289 RepID=UPI0029C9AEA8|nr:tetratricopeptide repeat protein [uncultured Desulfosarcina sp.]